MMKNTQPAWRRGLRTLGPAIPTAPVREGLRAGVGAAAALGVSGLLVLAPDVDLRLGLYMVAPFGASAVLLFAAPNSPLAQPWSAVVGNVASALAGVAVVMSIPDRAASAGLAVGLAILAMSLLRALHPPGGAVALTAALAPDAVRELGFRFALAPVGLGTVLLVALAMVWARATGRRYPFRQAEAEDDGTGEPIPQLGLDRSELEEILVELRQGANIGVEDLARLIAAAELRAAAHRLEGLTCADVMSRDLVTVLPEAPMHRVAELFRRHGFTSLPVVAEYGRYLGAIFQIHLIRRGQEDSARLGRSLPAAMRRLFDRGRRNGPVAADLMAVGLPRVSPTAPVGSLLPLLAEGEFEAVPVLDGGRIIGIVTRTDLVGALARRVLPPPPPAPGG